MASDDDIIYVDISPRLDESATEKETGRLRDKLKDGVKGAGKAIGDALHSELAHELGQSIGPMARNAGEELGKELGSRAGNLLHDQIADALKGVGVDFDGVIDKAGQLGDKFGISEEKIGKLTDAFKDFKAGDTAKGVSDLTTALAGMPGPLGDVANKTKDISDRFDTAKGNIKETTAGFLELTNNSGRIAGGLSAIAGAAAPLAATFAALDALMPGFDQHLNNVINQLQGKQGFSPRDWINTLIPGTNLLNPLAPPSVQQPPQRPMQNNPPLPGSPAVEPGYTATPGSLDPFTALLPPGMQPPAGAPGAAGPALPSIAPPDTGGGVGAHTSSAITGGTPHQATLVDWTSGGGGGSAGGGPTVPLIQNPDGTWTSTNPAWAHLIQRESSGINQRQQIRDVNSGGNEAEGLFQITPATWRSHGGTNFAPNPLAATPEQQARIAASILQGNPSGSDWGAGLPGRESPGGLLSGLGPGNVMPTGYGSGGGKTGGNNFYKDWYGTGAGSPSPPAMGGYTPRPTQGGTGGGDNAGGGNTGGGGGTTQQPLGHGSGIGISGGMIGMAEQAGAMAAGAMTFGAGGMAAQVAEQEMNLAIQKGGQMAAVAAMAPLETFGLTGGQMGAPSVTPGGGWPGKLLGGLIGQQTNTPNIAGKTQPPKQPQEDSSQNDPGGGNGGKSQGGAGPSGDHDDPIHVKSVSPGGPPQGAATSAMSGIGYMSGSTV